MLVWAAANPDLAHRVMVAFLQAARDLALADGWKQGRNMEVILKYTTAKADVLKKARPHVLDPYPRLRRVNRRLIVANLPPSLGQDTEKI